MLTLEAPPLATLPAYSPVESVETVQGVWSAAYVRSRQEKAFAEDLSEAGIPNYLPITQRRGVLNGKRTTICEPTFRGYCFFAMRHELYADDFDAVTHNSRLVQRIEIRDQKLFVKELSQIQRALEHNPSLGSCMNLVPGRMVRVTKGPFIGCEGKLEKHTKGVFHLALTVMQMSVEVQMPDETYLEPID